MSSCPSCAKAEKVPDYPMYQAACKGCAVRAIAQGPQFHASGVDGALSASYRKALAGIFGDDWRAGHELVKAAAKHIRDAKALL